MNIEEMICQHEEWCIDHSKGQRADFTGMDLSYTNFNDRDMRFAIFTNTILITTSFRNTDLRGAQFNGAVMWGVDLSGASLIEANLDGVDLRHCHMEGTTGNGVDIFSAHFSPWPVSWTKTHLQIGCQRYPIDTWWRYSDEAINNMHPHALSWWKKWKSVIQQLVIISRSTA
jgi:hypothetical protein